MAVKEVAEWSTTDASNNFATADGGWPELMSRSDVNDVARRNMGAIRRWYDDPEWLDLTVGASLSKTSATVLSVLGADYRAYFTDGRRVKITESSGGPTYATVSGTSTFGGGNTAVTLKEFTSPESATEIPADLVAVFLHITSDLDSSAFMEEIFVRVPVLTDVGLQAAVDALEGASGDGGIIVLEPDATYVIASTVLIGDGADPGNIRIMGRGATLQAGSNLDDEIMDVRDDTPAAVVAKVVLEDIIFDGNSSAQTGTAGVGMLNIGEDTSFVTVRNCSFEDSYGHGITIKTSSSNIWVEGCRFLNTGEDGISIEDSDNDLDQVYVSRCSFENPAVKVSGSAGLTIAGKVQVSDCQFVELDHASDNQIGITFTEKLAASPSDQAGKQSTVTGCSFEGTGANAIGIKLQGRENVVSACSFRLTGAAAVGISVIDDGSEETNFHVISACNFLEPLNAIRMSADSEDCIITGCHISGCPTAYRDGGTRNKFSSNVIDTCTDGVTIDTGTTDAVISDNTIETASDNGIQVASGATRTQLYMNYIRNATTADIGDSAAATVLALPEHFYSRIMYLASGVATAVETTTNGVEYAFDYSAISFTDYADAVRSWHLRDFYCNIAITLEASEQNFTLRLRLGTNRTGTITLDTAVWTDTVGTGDYVGPGDYSPDFGNRNHAWLNNFVPDSGDELYMTVERTGGAGGQRLYFTLDDETVVGESCYWRAEPRPRLFT